MSSISLAEEWRETSQVPFLSAYPAPSNLCTHPLTSMSSREYQVENKEIGHGNFSTVYRAVHKQCGKAYAIKRSKRPLHDANDLQAWIEVRFGLIVCIGCSSRQVSLSHHALSPSFPLPRR